MTSFDEYKSKVSIIQVLEDLGYRLDKSKGRVTPTYKLYDGKGDKIDEIIIKNPLDSKNQYYFDRNHKGGDLISFLRNHISKFPQFHHHNEYVHINKILGHYSKIEYVPKVESSSSFIGKQDFDKNRFTETKPEIQDLTYLTRERNISRDVVEEFLPFIVKVKDNQANNDFQNIAFPYTTPGKQEVSNYELRNYGFKGMASGGDKTNAVWIATNAPNPNLVKDIYFFESAIDAMSFYELNKSKLNLENSALISVGGYLSHNQILNSINHFPNAKLNTAFDNDINGRLYDIRTYAIAHGKNVGITKKEGEYQFIVGAKTFTLPEDKVSLENFRENSGFRKGALVVHKAANNMKDFNEVLKTKNQQSHKPGMK
ncbi:DUF3991 and toprim domain-containing protein [Bacteroidales bacterium OttesenSCG-928-B11]|nr:DUF3991 and toprim domain-containing protein [Bacteroidales bacterium OttesenSCG-928-E04]MDL2312561.1 DUF3991 and toprim domain-containing protein [Bacteroidales bacterium OttesenSCG-928-B11]MDL2325824.1 DUF3991 and toprim domain-containing protein [Bacteroidales bacterium OttesenSCG-928-A14]